MVLVSRRERVLALNPAAELLLGWTERDLHGAPLGRLIPMRLYRRPEAPWESPDWSGAGPGECKIRRPDATTLQVMLTRRPWESGGSGQWLLILRDLTIPGRAILESIGDAIVMTDGTGAITYLNPAAVRLTGWGREEALDQPVARVMVLISESSRESIPDTTTRCLRENRPVDLEDGVLLVRRDGTEIPISDSAAPIRDQDGNGLGVVLVIRDEGERRRVGHRLRFEATHDDLTGLINRREFEQRLARSLTGTAQGSSPEQTLLYLDLDNFKQINDTCGHAAGDRVLQTLGALLGGHMRTRDTLARLGGDEFGALLVDCSIIEGIHMAESLREAIAQHRVEWEGQVFSLTASIGVFPLAPVLGVAGALRAADAACYEAKHAGGDRVHGGITMGDAGERPGNTTRSILPRRWSREVVGRPAARASPIAGPGANQDSAQGTN